MGSGAELMGSARFGARFGARAGWPGPGGQGRVARAGWPGPGGQGRVARAGWPGLGGQGWASDVVVLFAGRLARRGPMGLIRSGSELKTLSHALSLESLLVLIFR
jgi:hypothetical protein